ALAGADAGGAQRLRGLAGGQPERAPGEVFRLPAVVAEVEREAVRERARRCGEKLDQVARRRQAGQAPPGRPGARAPVGAGEGGGGGGGGGRARRRGCHQAAGLWASASRHWAARVGSIDVTAKPPCSRRAVSSAALKKVYAPSFCWPLMRRT